MDQINSIKTKSILPIPIKEYSACFAIQAAEKPSNPTPSPPKNKDIDQNQASISKKTGRTPLPSAPLAPTRFAYNGRAYDSWQARKRTLRRRGIEIRIREPSVAEKRLKYRCKELSGLRWSQTYFEK
ncbi:f1f25c33-914a-4b9d-a30d-976baacc4e55-CDS [Sclerotinia trifoliorum]|uniref:F1f25c33-914a-4b9d-a30d-976baacc4e55-CDS n=1 Tax=Sclerotinia trifoliorum TaxID=28548 RepID=A0A8H2VYY5_9HELO|nr:f1f25c33-914a-4b9d-a30d-976baacc4e55-CDS [Sclerotinia trifoliorum]